MKPETEVDWRQQAAKLVDKGYGRAVADAQQQAIDLFDTPDYWEAVYTLAVQALGGTIECDTAPGKGTRFTLRIPVKEAVGV